VATQCYEWDKPPVYVPDTQSSFMHVEFGRYKVEWSYRSDYDIYWQQQLLVNQLRDVISEYSEYYYENVLPTLKKPNHWTPENHKDTRTYFSNAFCNFSQHVPRYYNRCTFKLRIHKIDLKRIPWRSTLKHVARLIEQTPLIQSYRFLDRVQLYPRIMYRSDVRSRALNAYENAIATNTRDAYLSPIDYFAPILDAKSMKLLEYDLMLRELSGD
jgi:hypothetical protein